MSLLLALSPVPPLTAEGQSDNRRAVALLRRQASDLLALADDIEAGFPPPGPSTRQVIWEVLMERDAPTSLVAIRECVAERRPRTSGKAIDVALSRLVRQRRAKRVGRGVYEAL